VRASSVVKDLIRQANAFAKERGVTLPSADVFRSNRYRSWTFLDDVMLDFRGRRVRYHGTNLEWYGPEPWSGRDVFDVFARWA